MDVATVVTAVASSLGISVSAAAWLSQSLISHRLGLAKVEFEAELKRRVDLELGERAAQRTCEVRRAQAPVCRRRSASVPTTHRLQRSRRPHRRAGRRRALQDVARRLLRQSTLYRILRPLCLAQMVERQIAIADFSVDKGAIDLLRFRKAAFNALSGAILVGGHPDLDWNVQREHVFADNLTRCAHALIVSTATESRTMTFHEFSELLDDEEKTEQLQPFPSILSGFTPSTKPIFWMRLAGYGHLCNEFVAKAGATVGFEPRAYPTRELLQLTRNRFVGDNIDDYVKRCSQLTALQL